MITIGNIQDRLKNNLFPKDNPDKLNQDCYKREEAIKKTIMRAFNSLIEHVEKPDFKGKLNHWQNDKIERNTKNLLIYIDKLYEKLNSESIIDYVKNKPAHRHLSIDEDDFLLQVNSYYGCIIYDILWARDISVSDVLNITTKGIIDNKNLEKKLPEKIKFISKKIIPYFDKISEYTEAIKESVKSYKNKTYKGASLTVLVAIEGLVRKLGKKLIIKQNIDNSYLDKQHNSLDSFLRNIPWKKDCEIEKSRLMFITGDYEFHDNSKQTINKELISVNLKTRLDFLRRIFKKDRDKVLHGESNKIGNIYDLYRNFSALEEVYLTIEYYENNYC
jgi:hypothetical protein